MPENFVGVNSTLNESSDGDSTSKGSGYIDRALDVLEGLEDYDSKQVLKTVLYQLNLWIHDQPEDPDWQADALHGQLSDRFADVAGVEPSSVKFEGFDFFVLREAVWMRDIAQSVVRAKRDQLRRAKMSDQPAWLSQLRKTRGDEVADDLRVATWLFDWTIRNIQLDEISADGPRPGAKLYAWESLLLGHGDYLNRARIFLLLARQHDIDVAMLKFVNDDAPDQADVWLAGVLLGEQIFLFDTRLGLPIPDLTGSGVATLSLIQEQAELLRSLDLSPDDPYWLSEGHLNNVQARVDGTPASLSRRMQLLERSFSNIRVATSASNVAVKARRSKGITDVRLWTVPYDAFLYHRDLQSDDETRRDHDRQFETLAELGPLYKGRLLHFRGAIETIDETLGAKRYYLGCRPSKKQIEDSKNSPEFKQVAQAIKRSFPPEAAKERAKAEAETLATLIQLRIQIKQSASYWLGLIFSDQGEHTVAVDYFAQRTLKASPNGPWTNGAMYNLARSYAALGDFDKAIKLYESDTSPQRHGNRIRAKRLAARAVVTDRAN